MAYSLIRVHLELVIVIGKLAEAADNFELCYSLTKGKTDWLTADGETSMHSLSCGNLTRIYTSIATQFSEQNDHESSLQYLIRAYEKSKEGQCQLFTVINKLRLYKQTQSLTHTLITEYLYHLRPIVINKFVAVIITVLLANRPCLQGTVPLDSCSNSS